MTTDRPSALSGVLWPAVVALAVVVGGLVAMFALAPSGHKPDLAPLFAALVTGIVAGVPALAAYLRSRSNSAMVVQHGQTLAKIDRQTNGQLDARIKTAVTGAMDARPDLFTAAGVAQAVASTLESHLADVRAVGQSITLPAPPTPPTLDLPPASAPAVSPAAPAAPTQTTPTIIDPTLPSTASTPTPEGTPDV